MNIKKKLLDLLYKLQKKKMVFFIFRNIFHLKKIINLALLLLKCKSRRLEPTISKPIILNNTKYAKSKNETGL